jgi:2-polyprenyl-3-methyl-5-hydroxy-6-metoxy-1,4-benzoquinol methylase
LQQPLPENYNGFDLIVSIEMLEYPRNDVDVLRNLRTAVHPDGRLLLSVMNKEGRGQDPSFGFRKLQPRREAKAVPLAGAARAGYTMEELVEKMNQAGWESVSQMYLFGYAPMLAHTLFEVYRNVRWLPYLATPLLRLLCRPFIFGAGNDGGAVLSLGKAKGWGQGAATRLQPE